MELCTSVSIKQTINSNFNIAFLTFFFGTFVGSFLNVVIYRVPRHESIVFPPSHCTRCGTILRPWDLIPIFSWIFSGGRCRYCGGKVSYRYAAIEFIEGVLFFIVTLFLYPDIFLIVKTLFFLSFILLIIVYDIKFQIIPDGINLSIFVAGLIFLLLEYFFKFSPGYKTVFPNLLLDGFFAFALGAGSLWLIGFLGEKIFKRPAMGGGDIKLMAGLSLFIGYQATAIALLLSFVIGAIMGILLLILPFGKGSTYIPFGPYLGLGTMVVYFCGYDKIISLWKKIFEHLLYWSYSLR